ncbi:MAG: glycosyltransferase [Chitinophagaceae bacterium]
MKQAKPILWLASWYPNKFGPFDGDFVQRHAMAVSALRPVEVLVVRKGVAPQMDEKLKIESSTRAGLTETIGYYKPWETGIGILNRLLSFLQYLRVYRKLIKEFISREGLPDIVHVHVTMRAGLLGLWLRKKYNIPYVITEHWTGFSTRAEDNFYQQNWLFRKTAVEILRNAQMILPVCNYLADEMKKIVIGPAYVVIGNVVDTGIFQPASVPDGPIRFFHASSLNKQKNPEAILRAFAVAGLATTDWRLVVAGPASQLLKNSGIKLGLADKITWLGEISYHQVADKMKSSDLLIMFSRFENLPCVIAEALCCGLKVISNPVGGIPEMLNASNGILVNNETQLAAAIKKSILEGRPQLRKEIAEISFSKYNYAKIAAAYDAVYRNIMT